MKAPLFLLLTLLLAIACSQSSDAVQTEEKMLPAFHPRDFKLKKYIAATLLK